VTSSSGTSDQKASTAAGRKLAAAVPDVHTAATGLPEATAAPSAKNADERSSVITHGRRRESRASATASGVERPPGEMQTSRTPQRQSSSSSAAAARSLQVPVVLMRAAPRRRGRRVASLPPQRRAAAPESPPS